MPAVFYPAFWKLLYKAIEDVGHGTRKVQGNGYSVYRVGATIRCDLKPQWVSSPEDKDPTQAHLDEMVEAGQAEAEAEAMYHEQLAEQRGEAEREREGPHGE